MQDQARRLADCQRVIGYFFADQDLLTTALTHSSLRSPDRECNERLEFLGDSVLGLVITEELYRQLPDSSEGEMTRIKSAVVSRSALYSASVRLGLAQFADYARGVGKRDDLPTSVVANLVESVIGAIYIDAGYYPAREFVLRHLGSEIEDMLNDRGVKNYKSLLQHDAQEAVGITPHYRTVEEEGPDHDKVFVVAAVIQGKEWGRASGANKKEAEQEAARRALEAFSRRGRGRRRRRRRKPAFGDAERAEQVEGAASAGPDPVSAAPEAAPAERASASVEAAPRGEGAAPKKRKRRSRRKSASADPEPAADRGSGNGSPDEAPESADVADATDSQVDGGEGVRRRRKPKDRMPPSQRTAKRPPRRSKSESAAPPDPESAAADPEPAVVLPPAAEPEVAKDVAAPIKPARRRRKKAAAAPASPPADLPADAPDEEPPVVEAEVTVVSEHADAETVEEAGPGFGEGLLEDAEPPPEQSAGSPHPDPDARTDPDTIVEAPARAKAPKSKPAPKDDFGAGL